MKTESFISNLVDKRNRVLVEAYILSQGVPLRPVSLAPSFEALGITEDEFLTIWRQLSGLGLMANQKLGDKVSLTPVGVTQAEELHRTALRENRSALLAAIYQLTNGDVSRETSIAAAAAKTDLDENSIRSAYTFLSQSGLISGPAGMNQVSITVAGIRDHESRNEFNRATSTHIDLAGATIQNLSNVIQSPGSNINQIASGRSFESFIDDLEKALLIDSNDHLEVEVQNLIGALRNNKLVEVAAAADEIAKHGPDNVSKLKDFASRAASSGVGGGLVLCVKAVLAAHGIHVP